MSQTFDLNSYRRDPGAQQGGVQFGGNDITFGAVADPSAPWIVADSAPQPMGYDPSFDEYAQFAPGGQPGHVSSPAMEMKQLADKYVRTDANNVAHIVERLSITKRMGELAIILAAEAAEGKDTIMELLGIPVPSKPKPRPRAKAKPKASDISNNIPQ